MSDDTSGETNRRTMLKLAGLAGLPLLAGNASAASGDHLGETWSGDPVGSGLTIEISGSADGLECDTTDGMALRGLSENTIGIYGYSGGSTAILGESFGDDHGVEGVATDDTHAGVYGTTWGDGYGVYSDGDLHVEGDFTASGTKNFVQTVDTPDGPREVAYTAVEADQAQTETTGVGELEKGRAEIDLPDHFGLVTSSTADLVVQLTPYAIDTEGLAVTDRSTDRIVVETIDGDGDFEFSYTVRGVREGYEDEEVVLESE